MDDGNSFTTRWIQLVSLSFTHKWLNSKFYVLCILPKLKKKKKKGSTKGKTAHKGISFLGTGGHYRKGVGGSSGTVLIRAVEMLRN